MEIRYYPDPVLARRAAPVAADREGLGDLVARMLEAMVEARGVGLAAPQVGESLRLFVASPGGEPQDALVCVNPRVQPYGPVVEQEEGCLSVPGIRAVIARPSLVRLSWRDLDGRDHEEEFDGLMARILQHENDHIDGVLFIERMTPADRIRIRQDLLALEEQFLPR
jgi:peptide deformylase